MVHRLALRALLLSAVVLLCASHTFATSGVPAQSATSASEAGAKAKTDPTSSASSSNNNKASSTNGDEDDAAVLKELLKDKEFDELLFEEVSKFGELKSRRCEACLLVTEQFYANFEARMKKETDSLRVGERHVKRIEGGDLFESVCQQVAQMPYVGDPAIIRCGHFLFKNIDALNKHFSDNRIGDVNRFMELKASFCNKIEPGCVDELGADAPKRLSKCEACLKVTLDMIRSLDLARGRKGFGSDQHVWSAVSEQTCLDIPRRHPPRYQSQLTDMCDSMVERHSKSVHKALRAYLADRRFDEKDLDKRTRSPQETVCVQAVKACKSGAKELRTRKQQESQASASGAGGKEADKPPTAKAPPAASGEVKQEL